VERHSALGKSEQRVIPPHPDIVAGVELGSPLTNENIAGNDNLAAKSFDAKPLAG
jgi:hypothetical protein